MSKSRNAKARKSIGKFNATQGEALQRKSSRPLAAGQLGGGAAPGIGKLASMIAMLRRPKGATIDQIMTATGWQAHSVRGAISGALKKKRGLTVTSAAESGGIRVYRIAG